MNSADFSNSVFSLHIPHAAIDYSASVCHFLFLAWEFAALEIDSTFVDLSTSISLF